jgi:TPR repeat protein
MNRALKTAIAALILATAFAGLVMAEELEDAAFAAAQRGDYATAVKIWLPLAGQGNPAAQSNLAKMYLTGRGVTQNYAEALRWFRKVADQGDSEAQYNVGVIYYQGQGIKKNEVEGIIWLRKSADQGNADAQFALGAAYYVGGDIKKNYAEALTWFSKAAEQGNGDAQYNLGTMYSRGQGVPPDYRAAVTWYRKAADQGVADAKTDLAALYGRFPALRGQPNNPSSVAPAGSKPSGQPQANDPTAAPDRLVQNPAPPISMHSGWVTIKNDEVTPDGFMVFRRYGYLEQDGLIPFANLIMFACSKDVTNAASHLTFVLPKGFQPKSFPRETWLPKTSVRFLINDHRSVEMPGEYRNGEFFFDWNPDTDKNFSEVMLSDKIALGFGEKNDIIQFQFTDAIDKAFSQIAPKLTVKAQSTHYARDGVGGVLEACRAYQQRVKSGSPAAPAPSIAPNEAKLLAQNPSTPPTPEPKKPAQKTNDPRCSKPPYGGAVEEFQAFIKNLGYIFDSPSVTLSGICNAKFGSGDRTLLYEMGITDDDIANKSTYGIAIDLIRGLRNFAKKREANP